MKTQLPVLPSVHALKTFPPPPIKSRFKLILSDETLRCPFVTSTFYLAFVLLKLVLPFKFLFQKNFF